MFEKVGREAGFFLQHSSISLSVEATSSKRSQVTHGGRGRGEGGGARPASSSKGTTRTSGRKRGVSGQGYVHIYYLPGKGHRSAQQGTTYNSSRPHTTHLKYILALHTHAAVRAALFVRMCDGACFPVLSQAT